MEWEIGIFHLMAAKRVFVAIPIPDRARREIARAVERLRRSDADVRWVSAENYHVTLKFLGEMEETLLARLSDDLQRIAAHASPFTLTFGDAVIFPSLQRSRVVAVGFRGDVETLKSLASEIEECASKSAIPPERRGFTAHLTIGRVKSQRNIAALQQAFSRFTCAEAGEMKIDRFHLYESVLLPQGARHSIIGDYGLGGASVNSRTSQGS